jgi:hypothetical protein
MHSATHKISIRSFCMACMYALHFLLSRHHHLSYAQLSGSEAPAALQHCWCVHHKCCTLHSKSSTLLL